MKKTATLLLLAALGARTDAPAELLRFQVHLARDDARALTGWFDAIAANALSAATWADISQQLHASQWGELALLASERALADDPFSAQLMSNHGFILRHCGKLNDAARWLDRALTSTPAQGEAQLIRAELPAPAPEENLQKISALLKVIPASSPEFAPLCYAAARYCEQLSRWDDTMQWLHRGARAKRASFQYQVERDEQMLVALATTPLPDIPEVDEHSSEQARPLFIVGLPRTGSSLLEAHLASHPAVTAAGELPHFNRALMQQFQAQYGRPPASPQRHGPRRGRSAARRPRPRAPATGCGPRERSGPAPAPPR